MCLSVQKGIMHHNNTNNDNNNNSNSRFVFIRRVPIYSPVNELYNQF